MNRLRNNQRSIGEVMRNITDTKREASRLLSETDHLDERLKNGEIDLISYEAEKGKITINNQEYTKSIQFFYKEADQ